MTHKHRLSETINLVRIVGEQNPDFTDEVETAKAAIQNVMKDTEERSMED